MLSRQSTPMRTRRIPSHRPSRIRQRSHRVGRSLEQLEGRIALTVSPQDLSLAGIAGGGCPLCGEGGCRHTTTAEGQTFVACNFNVSSVSRAASLAQATAALAPLDQTFQLQSRPSATKTIYLDFTGHTTSGTSWKSGATIVTPEYNTDGRAGFSDQELRNIQDIWARVVEDFSPFDVNVTTAEPSIDDLRKVGAGDTRWGIRALIGVDSGSVAPGAGGVAYLGSFNWNSDTPCFVFPERLGNNNKSIAEATSHEIGHALGLSHDGRSSPSEGYYTGHGTGTTGWAPIMGVGYSREVVQWSRGEYTSANNTEDDLGIIVGTVTNQWVPNGNGFGYRPDDYGGNVGTAHKPTVSGGTPTSVAGIIERASDIDVFEFATSGRFTAMISPATVSPNLDILAEIWDAAGSVLYTSNPLAALNASFNLTLTAGKYYLAIQGTGTGNPTIGYSDYASIGQYTATVTVDGPVLPSLSIAAAAADRLEGNAGATAFSFTVSRSGTLTGASTAAWIVGGSGSNPASGSDFVGGGLPSGTVSFAAGEATKTIVIEVAGDGTAESDETFTVSLSSPSGAVLGTPVSATGIIRNEDALPILSVAAVDVSKNEGDSGATPFVFTVTRTGSTSETASATWSVAGSGPAPANAEDFLGGVLPSGTVTFAVGETSQTITVIVQCDAAVEEDERFTVALSNPIGGTILGGPAVSTIVNDDLPPAISIVASGADKPEGSSGATSFLFTVTRSGNVSGNSTVLWSVAGTGAAAASASDFVGGVLPSRTLTFAAGETTKSIEVAVQGDSTPEEHEGFSVTLSGAVAARLTTSKATAVIRNDDFLSTLSIAEKMSAAAEGNTGRTPFTFTVVRTGDLVGNVTVRWVVTGTGDRPADRNDFIGATLPSGTARLASGMRTQTITVNVLCDRRSEADEEFTVSIFDAIGRFVGMAESSSATGLILNDDAPFNLAPSATQAVFGQIGRTNTAVAAQASLLLESQSTKIRPARSR